MEVKVKATLGYEAGACIFSQYVLSLLSYLPLYSTNTLNFSTYIALLFVFDAPSSTPHPGDPSSTSLPVTRMAHTRLSESQNQGIRDTMRQPTYSPHDFEVYESRTRLGLNYVLAHR